MSAVYKLNDNIIKGRFNWQRKIQRSERESGLHITLTYQTDVIITVSTAIQNQWRSDLKGKHLRTGLI